MFERSFVVGSCGITRIVKILEMTLMPCNLNEGSELSLLTVPRDSFEARCVVSPVAKIRMILRWCCDP